MGKTSILVIAIIFFSKILGLLREIIFSYYFGASKITDAFFLSSSIVTVISGMLFSGIATMYIPTYINKSRNKDIEIADNYRNNLKSILLLLSLIIIFYIYCFSNSIIGKFAPGFENDTKNIASSLLKVSSISLIFNSYVLIGIGDLKIKKNFTLSSIIPLINNLILIIFSSYAFKYGYLWIGFAYVLGYFFQAIILKIVLRKKGFKDKYIFKIGSGIKKTIILAFPVMFSSSLSIINNLVDKIIGSNLTTGSISLISYATFITGTLFGLISSMISTIFFPILSEKIQNNEDLQSGFIEFYFIYVVMIILPIVLFMTFYSKNIVGLIYGRGAFGIESVQRVSEALKYLSSGIIFATITNISINVCYAMCKTKNLIWINLTVVGTNIILSIILTPLFGLKGLVFATSFSGLCGMIVALITLKKEKVKINYLLIFNKIVRIIVASIIMIIIVKKINIPTERLNNFVILLFNLSISMVIYLFLINLFKVIGYKEIVFKIKSKLI